MAFPVGSQIQDMVQQKLKLSLTALQAGGQGLPSQTPHTVQAACTSNTPEKVQRSIERLLELLSLKGLIQLPRPPASTPLWQPIQAAEKT